MPVNKYKDETIGSLLNNKLALSLLKFNERYTAGDYEHAEEVQDAFVAALREFTDEPHVPAFKGLSVRPGDYPDIELYTDELDRLGDDLLLLVSEVKNLQDVMVVNFNSISRQESQVEEGMKRIRSKLGDLKLYGTGALSENIYFSDSFSTMDRLDLESPLLSKAQAAIQNAEGIVTLPFEEANVELAKIRRLVINEASNGRVGNRVERRRILRSELTNALDGNPDTWVEYEKSFRPGERREFEEFQPPLILDMTAILQEETVINRIVLNPNHFGTKDWIKIRTIETSRNGTDYSSVLDDIPESEWTVDERGTLLSLAPSASKFGGMGVFTFLPRKARYIRVVLEQDQFHTTTSWEDEGTDKVTFRYAIGLRDFLAFGIRFEAEGQIISAPYDSDLEIKKVGILTNENSPAPLVEISHEVSHDDGQSWNPLNSIERSDPNIQEVLTFNLGEGTIQTPSQGGAHTPVKRLRYRATLKRNTRRFSEAQAGAAPLIAEASEVHTLPSGGPFSVALENEPIGIARAVRPMIGTVGQVGAPTVLDSSRQVGSVGQLTIYELPFKVPHYWNSDHYSGFENVKVGGNTWLNVWDSAAPPPAGSYFADNDNTTAAYYIDYKQGRVIFGDGGDSGEAGQFGGRKPDPGLPITIYLSPEPLVIAKDSPHTCELYNPHDYIPENMRIRAFGLPVDDQTAGNESLSRETIPPGATQYQLPLDRLVLVPEVAGYTEITFIDGQAEFTAGEDKFSFDPDTNIVYLNAPTADNSAVEFRYVYKQITELVYLQDWEITGPQQVSIKPHAFFQHEGTYALQVNNRRVDLLADLRSNTDWDMTTVSSPSLPRGHGSIVPGSLMIPTNAGVPPRDGNGRDIYRQEVPFIDGRSEFEFQTTEDEKVGLYSVDYREGVLYSYATAPAAWAGGSFVFKYVDYHIEYGIGAPLSVLTSPGSRRGTLIEGEVLEVFKDAAANNRNERLVKVLYEYVSENKEPIKDLEPYYTPILRDYSLLVVPIDKRLGEVS